MPDMDGFTLVEQLREDPRWSDLPVVLLTSTHVQNEFEQCERLQVSAQVVKPVKQSDLLDAITRAIGTRRSRQAGTTGTPGRRGRNRCLACGSCWPKIV